MAGITGLPTGRTVAGLSAAGCPHIAKWFAVIQIIIKTRLSAGGIVEMQSVYFNVGEITRQRIGISLATLIIRD